MDKVNGSIASTRESLLEDFNQTSRKRRKLGIIISFILLFSIIIGSIISVLAVLKNKIEAQSLSDSENPAKLIRSVCSVTPFPTSCFDSIWDFHFTNRFNPKNPSEIFSVSLRVASFELHQLISRTQLQFREANSTTLEALRECEILFKESMKLVHRSMEVMDHHGDENVFKKNKNIIVVLRPWIWNATRNLERCINGMKGKILGSENGEEDLDEVRMMRSMIDYMSKEYMENCLMMIVKMDDILDMFDPNFKVF